MKTLHVYNLANVAYGYAKALNQSGAPADLLTHDTNHLMSQPEWEDLELDSDLFPDENNFFDNGADLTGYSRPPWFEARGILDSGKSDEGESSEAESSEAESSEAESDEGEQSPYKVYYALYSSLRRVWAILPSSFKSLSAPLFRLFFYNLLTPLILNVYSVKHMLVQFFYNRLQQKVKRIGSEYRFSFFEQKLFNNSSQSLEFLAFQRKLKTFERRIDYLSELSLEYGQEWYVPASFLKTYLYHALWQSNKLDEGDHDVVFSYVLAPIYSMIANSKPYVSIEIGTMREIPFDGTPQGKALALAYRLSPHILITNPDVIEKAELLGLSNYSFCPHPFDEGVYFDDETNSWSELRAKLLKLGNADTIIFCPARQNWRLKGNDIYLKAFSEYLKKGFRSIMVIPGWGQEIERSKKLCKKLGIEDSVHWIKPQSEPSLAKYYKASDFVLDQFVLGVFGLTTPKALAAGSVVITSYNDKHHSWCFPEHPPLVPSDSIESLSKALIFYSSNPEAKELKEKQGREWIKKYHSAEVIVSILNDSMRSAKNNFEGNSEKLPLKKHLKF